MSGKIITVLSTKGGVGKSFLARMISIIANEEGKKVCIIDTCQNSSVATGFFRDRDSFLKSGYDWLTEEAKVSEVIQQYLDSDIYYIPSDERIDEFQNWVSKKVPKVRQIKVLAERISPLKKVFDYIIIDTHPSENSDLVNYSIAASDFCLIPTEISSDSKLASIRCMEIIKDYQEAGFCIDFGFTFNKVDTTRGAKNQIQKMMQDLEEEGLTKEKILGSVRYSTVVAAAQLKNLSLTDYKNKYAENVIKDVRKVAREVFSRVDGEKLI